MILPLQLVRAPSIDAKMNHKNIKKSRQNSNEIIILYNLFKIIKYNFNKNNNNLCTEISLN